MNADSIEIVPLQDPPGALPICAGWLNDEWGEEQGFDLAETKSWLEDIIAPGSGEHGLVAMAGTAPVGTCLLVKCDLERRRDLTPWVSALYVLPAYRGRSIGSRLLAGIENAARKDAVELLYLYTYRVESFYAGRGWHAIERFDEDGRNFVVMRKRLL